MGSEMCIRDSIFGMQTALEKGPGEVVASTRDKRYGNPNMTANGAYHGTKGNFAQRRDAVGNSLTTDFNNQTGFGPDAGTSATINPEADPRQIGQDAEMRMKMIAKGIQYQGLNDRQQMYRA